MIGIFIGIESFKYKDEGGKHNFFLILCNVSAFVHCICIVSSHKDVLCQIIFNWTITENHVTMVIKTVSDLFQNTTTYKNKLFQYTNLKYYYNNLLTILFGLSYHRNTISTFKFIIFRFFVKILISFIISCTDVTKMINPDTLS